MIYIFGGVGKTGCSTLAIDFANQFGMRRAYGGAYMKGEAIKAGFYRPEYILPQDQSEWDIDQANVPGFRAMCEQTGRNIDAEIEGYLLKEMITSQTDGEDIVVESKTMSRLLNSDVVNPLIDNAAHEIGYDWPLTREDLLNRTKAVWVHADLEVRTQRTLGRSRTPKAKGELGIQGLNPQEFSREAIERESSLLVARQMADKEDYSRIYGMTDYPVGNEIPPSTYGMVLMNNADKETAYSQVLQMMDRTL